MINAPLGERFPVSDRLPAPLWDVALSAARAVLKRQSVLVMGPGRSGKSSLLGLVLDPQFLTRSGLNPAGMISTAVTGRDTLNVTAEEFWKDLIMPQVTASVQDRPQLTERLRRFDPGKLDPFRFTDSILNELKRADLFVLVAWDDFDWHTENTRLDGAFFRKLRSLSMSFGVTYLLTSRRPFEAFPRLSEADSSSFPNIFLNMPLPVP